MSGAIPQEVLGDALVEAIRGRTVRAAIFTTYTFDPGFFELHILPFLFGASSPVDRVRLLRLEDHLRTTDVAVYYDRTALSQDATPARSNFRRIDVRRWTGVFHPKLILVLVEDPDPDLEDEDERDRGARDEGALAADHDADAIEPTYSLIVGTLSANLTRGGWWENVETAHFEEIQDREKRPRRCPFRKDLLSLVRRLRQSAPSDDQVALDQIHGFLRNHTRRRPIQNDSYKGRYYTRLFYGQTTLDDWFAELGLRSGDWNLEIISPYFDRIGAGTLDALVRTLGPKETRVYLPTNRDGSATVTRDYYDEVAEVAHWATLPSGVVRSSGSGMAEKVPSRWVHAKVYRIWRRDGPDLVLTGSVNLTRAAHSRANAGNLEAAFLVHINVDGRSRWWLERADHDPVGFAETQSETSETTDPVFVDITLEYDWSTEILRYRIEKDRDAPARIGPLQVSEPGGRLLFAIEDPQAARWTKCEPEATRKVADLLPSTSFLRVSNSSGSWRVLVREEGMSHKPSLLESLTPQEILHYWSLLSPEQKEAFLARKLEAEAQMEGLRASAADSKYGTNTIFDRFAGVYHAFGRLRIHVESAIRRQMWRDAETRLFGAKYDSLPVLLERLPQQEDADPVLTYVTFLCARQIRDRVREEFPEFWKHCQKDARRLNELLDQLPRFREEVGLDSAEAEFLDWYERMFLQEIDQAIGPAGSPRAGRPAGRSAETEEVR